MRSTSMENEKNVLRWGGLAGILAFVIWIIEMPLYGFVDPLIPEGLMRFPDIRVALAISTILCMTTAFLSIAFVLVLYRTLRGTGQAHALFGSVLSVIGFIGIALGDVSTFFAFDPLSNLYHATTATPEAQATIVLLWQATQGITNTFFFIGALFLMIGFIALGVAMIKTPTFGRRFGGVSIILGAFGAVGVVVSLFVFETIGLMFIADLTFLPLIGWKVYSLSREPRSPKT
jgi:hypothetical protein